MHNYQQEFLNEFICNTTCQIPCGIPDDDEKSNCTQMKNGNYT